MASQQEILKKIQDIVEKSAEDFNSTIPRWEKKILQELQGLLKNIDTKGDKIIPSVKNLRYVGDITRKLDRLILNDEDYKAEVKKYISSFNEISNLQNQYFNLLLGKFKATPLLQAIRETAIQTTLDGLSEVGISRIFGNIKQTLQNNVTTGGSYRKLMEVMAGQVTNTPQGFTGPANGSLGGQIKTYTITSIAQYSRNYAQTVAAGLNFTWFQYVGSTITTTRCFCHAMTKKRYFHKSEIPDIIAGRFDEFRELACALNEDTDLPQGMFKGTNASNFMTYAGGWNCQHSIFPVPDSAVPQALREKFK